MHNKVTITIIMFFAMVCIVDTKSVFASSSRPLNYAVIINQVRGNECCDAGSFSHTKSQLEYAIKLNLNTTFVLRYDALKNDEYIRLFKEYESTYPHLIRTGIMVEMVPSLITDTNDTFCITSRKSVSASLNTVETSTEKCEMNYTGTESTWFQAQHAFTIGYEPVMRKHIVDLLMKTYHIAFGRYPTVTSAWMIDTPTLNYLHDEYGIKTHQITREQWGTDSYTLYGGPPHYPYPASRNWLFIPDYNEESSVMIIRQTITDPLYNFGDNTSSYTSQPNDYVGGKRDIAYFAKLVDNALKQQNTGFVNVGLENSMEEQHQKEYEKQLLYIKQIRENNRVTIIDPDEADKMFSKEEVSVYAGEDGMRRAFWITTPHYRARVIQNEENLLLTDLRLYSAKFKDPYTNRIARHEGYWIVPFLIDGSRWYDINDITEYPHKFIPISNDYHNEPSSIVISHLIKTPVSIKWNDKNLSMVDAQKNEIASFSSTQFKLLREAYYQPHVPYEFPVQTTKDNRLQWILNTPLWEIQKKECGPLCLYESKINSNNIDAVVANQYPYIFPEAVGRSISSTFSKVTVSNLFAIANRNPIRLILEPHDKYNFPILLNREATVEVEPYENVTITRLGGLVSSKQQYIDISHDVPGAVDITVNMFSHNEDSSPFHFETTAYFAPNCKKDVLYCIFNPLHAVWYGITKFSDWWNERY